MNDTIDIDNLIEELSLLTSIWPDRNDINFAVFQLNTENIDILVVSENDYDIQSKTYSDINILDVFSKDCDISAMFDDFIISNNNFKVFNFSSKLNNNFIGVFIKFNMDNIYIFLCINLELNIKRFKRRDVTRDSWVAYKTFQLTSNNTELEREITRRKQSEEKLKNLNSQLEQFANLITHDLKSPLRYITHFTKKNISLINLLKTELENEDIKAQLTINASNILAQTKSLSKWIEDVFQISVVNNNNIQISSINIKDLILNIYDTVKYSVSTSVELKFDNISDDLIIYSDIILLESIFSNILTNAINYSYNRDIIEIVVGYIEVDSEYHFYIKDNGVGIDPKNLTDIFLEFKRFDSNTIGTGLGLAIVKRAINKLDGYIYAESDANGTSFIFNLGNIKQVYDK